MRRAVLPLALLCFASSAQANPFTILRAATQAGKVAAKGASVAAKGAGVAAKGAAKAGTVAKVGKVALGTTALMAADDAARLFAGVADDGVHAAMYVAHEESGAFRLISRAGDEGAHLAGGVDDAALAAAQGRPVALYLEPGAALRLAPGELPPEGQLWALTADGEPMAVTLADEGGAVRAQVKDAAGHVWDLAEFAVDQAFNADPSWTTETPWVVPVVGGPCPRLGEALPPLASCSAGEVMAWLRVAEPTAAVLILDDADDAAPYLEVGRVGGHDLTLLRVTEPSEAVAQRVTELVAAAPAWIHAPLLRELDLHPVQVEAGDPTVFHAALSAPASALPEAVAATWLLHLPVTAPVEAPAEPFTLGKALLGSAVMLAGIGAIVLYARAWSSRMLGRS